MSNEVTHWVDGEKIDPGFEDMVNHPKHYQINVKGKKIEVTELIETVLTREEYIGYLRGNILKYHIRAHEKNGDEDILKSNFYSVILDRILRETI